MRIGTGEKEETGVRKKEEKGPLQKKKSSSLRHRKCRGPASHWGKETIFKKLIAKSNKLSKWIDR